MRMTRSAVSERPSMSTPSTFRGRRTRRRWSGAVVVVMAGALTLTGTAGPALAGDRHHDRDKDNAFVQTNLVSDLPDLKLPVTDPLLKNPWGIAFGPATPLWTSNQFSNSSTLYRGVDAATAVKVPLEVKASSPTGIVFNPTPSFVINQGSVTAAATFIFNETTFGPTGPVSSSITGWTSTSVAPERFSTVTEATKDGAFYTGLALVPA